jgi:hypothetical protein
MVIRMILKVPLTVVLKSIKEMVLVYNCDSQKIWKILGEILTWSFENRGRGLQVSIDVWGNLGISTLLSIWHYYKCGGGGFFFL